MFLQLSENVGLLRTLVVGVTEEDVGNYTCLLINDLSVIRSLTIQLNVLTSQGPGSTAYIRLSTVNQSIIDAFLIERSIQAGLRPFESIVSGWQWEWIDFLIQILGTTDEREPGIVTVECVTVGR